MGEAAGERPRLSDDEVSPSECEGGWRLTRRSPCEIRYVLNSNDPICVDMCAIGRLSKSGCTVGRGRLAVVRHLGEPVHTVYAAYFWSVRWEGFLRITQCSVGESAYCVLRIAY